MYACVFVCDQFLCACEREKCACVCVWLCACEREKRVCVFVHVCGIPLATSWSTTTRGVVVDGVYRLLPLGGGREHPATLQLR